jgi:hypothetical protein
LKKGKKGKQTNKNMRWENTDVSTLTPLPTVDSGSMYDTAIRKASINRYSCDVIRIYGAAL